MKRCSRGDILMNEAGLYWVAVRGAAVPSWPLPVDEAEMRQAVVRVGDTPDETTMWLFGEDGAAIIGPSNYDYLIGYRSRGAQEAGIDILLRGSIEAARAEIRRARAEEIVIMGKPFQ